MNNFQVTPLFSSNIYVKQLEISDLNFIIEEVKKYELNSVSENRSNIGGFQADFNMNNETDVSHLIKKEILNATEDFPRMEINSMWMNINRKNNFNQTHVHPESDFSGVIYLKTPNNCGTIRFQNPHAFARSAYMRKISEQERAITSQYVQYQFEPKAGMLILFPPDLPHYVMPNNSDEERISVAFNIDFL